MRCGINENYWSAEGSGADMKLSKTLSPSSVRGVEKRVELMRKGQDTAQDAAKARNIPVAMMERPANGLPEDLREHAKLLSSPATYRRCTIPSWT